MIPPSLTANPAKSSGSRHLKNAGNCRATNVAMRCKNSFTLKCYFITAVAIVSASGRDSFPINPDFKGGGGCCKSAVVIPIRLKLGTESICTLNSSPVGLLSFLEVLVCDLCAGEIPAQIH